MEQAIEKLVAATDDEQSVQNYDDLQAASVNLVVPGNIDQFFARASLDVQSSNPQLGSKALKCLGLFVSNSVYVQNISDDMASAILLALIKIVKTTKNKEQCKLGIWCISVQQFKPSVLGSSIEELMDAIVHAMNNPMDSYSVFYEALQAICTVSRILPVKAKEYAEIWTVPIFCNLLNKGKKEKRATEKALKQSLPDTSMWFVLVTTVHVQQMRYIAPSNEHVRAAHFLLKFVTKLCDTTTEPTQAGLCWELIKILIDELGPSILTSSYYKIAPPWQSPSSPVTPVISLLAIWLKLAMCEQLEESEYSQVFQKTEILLQASRAGYDIHGSIQGQVQCLEWQQSTRKILKVWNMVAAECLDNIDDVLFGGISLYNVLMFLVKYYYFQRGDINDSDLKTSKKLWLQLHETACRVSVLKNGHFLRGLYQRVVAVIDDGRRPAHLLEFLDLVGSGVVYALTQTAGFTLTTHRKRRNFDTDIEEVLSVANRILTFATTTPECSSHIAMRMLEALSCYSKRISNEEDVLQVLRVLEKPLDILMNRQVTSTFMEKLCQLWDALLSSFARFTVPTSSKTLASLNRAMDLKHIPAIFDLKPEKKTRINKINDDDYVVIPSQPQKQVHLTDHQKEVTRLQQKGGPGVKTYTAIDFSQGVDLTDFSDKFSPSMELVTGIDDPSDKEEKPRNLKAQRVYAAEEGLTDGLEAKQEEGNTERKIQNYPVSFSIYHNVQDGDTMTSIAREYNTSMRSIALANKIEDINLLQTGQILQVPVQPRVFQKVTALVLQDTPENTSTSEQEAVSNVVQQQTSAPVRPWANSGLRSFVKFTAPFLLMVPVIALCVRGLVEVANQRIKLEVSRTQAEKEVWDAQHRPKLKRWQNILEGDRESDVLPIDAQLETTESETEEERKKREEDELRKSYEELEATYMKFLADSGLSRSGYWRGGIPSSG